MASGNVAQLLRSARYDQDGIMGSVYRKISRGVDLGWYAVYVDRAGKRRHVATRQPTKAAATVLLAEIEAKVRRGLVGVPEQKSAALFTVGRVFAQWLEDFSAPRIKDLHTHKTTVKVVMQRVLPTLGDVVVAELTARKVARLRDALTLRLAKNTVRTTLQTLAAVLTWGVREGLIADNPARGVALPRREIAVEYLDHDEVARLLAEAERRAVQGLRGGARQVAVMLAVLVGLRRGEIFGLRWLDLDLASGRLTVARSYRTTPKSGETRYLRIPPALLPVLTQWRSRCPRTAEELVVPVLHRGRWGMSGARVQHGLPELLIAAQCKPLRRGWHALRHTFASHFVMQGGNILTLAKILGHADIQMTTVYAQLAPEYLGEEMARVKYAPPRPVRAQYTGRRE